MRFHVILYEQPFSRAQSRMLISQTSQEGSFNYFLTRPLPIFVIWPKYATRAISHDSDTATFFKQLIAHANIPALPRSLLF